MMNAPVDNFNITFFFQILFTFYHNEIILIRYSLSQKSDIGHEWVKMFIGLVYWLMRTKVATADPVGGGSLLAGGREHMVGYSYRNTNLYFVLILK